MEEHSFFHSQRTSFPRLAGGSQFLRPFPRLPSMGGINDV